MAERDALENHLSEGERLMQNKLYDRAMVEFNKALQIDSKITNRALTGLFQQAEQTGDYEGLIAVGSNMLLHRPNNGYLANMLGNAYRKMGNISQAEKLYEHCLKYEADHRFAEYNMAAAMANVELYDSNAVSAVSPFEVMSWYKFADNEDGEKQLKDMQIEIEEEKEAKLAEEDQNEDTGEGWQDKLEQELKEEANKRQKRKRVELVPEELFNRIRKLYGMKSPTSLRLLRALALYCLQYNEAEIAWRTLTRLTFAFPKDENLQCFMAITYAMRNQEAVAEEKLIELLGKNRFSRFANVNLGILYKRQRKSVLSKKYFINTHLLLEKSMGHYDMYEFHELGEKYYQNGVHKNALKVFEVLNEETPSTEITYRLGRLYFETENYEKAVQTFKHLIDAAPDHAETKKALAEMNELLKEQARNLVQANKYSRGAQVYELSLEIEPSKEVVQDIISAYKLKRDDENVKRMTARLREIERLEKEKEIEESRLEKITEAKQFASKNQNYKAIRSYEEALRLKPEQSVLVRLVALYKKTRQHDMVEDVTNRYNKMIERQQRMAELENEEGGNG